MKLSRVKSGAITSYILILLNAAYGLLIAPYMLSTVGTSEYGVYKTIASLSASVMVLDLGLGGTMQRYVASFVAQGKDDECSNFTAMGLLQALFLNTVIAICCVCLYFSIDRIYSQSFTAAELQRAQQVFLLSALYIILHVFENVLSGVIAGYNRFFFSNTLKICLLIMRAALYFFVLPIFPNAVMISLGTLFMELGIVVLEILYLLFVLKLKFRLTRFDPRLFFDSMKYTFMMLLQTIAVQVNSNLDNIFVGSYLGSAAVTIYSFGLTIFNMFQQLSTAISGVMLPTVTKEIVDGASTRRLEDLVSRVGRVQFLLLGSAFLGFLLIGREFIRLYLSDTYMDVWVITLILMIPSLFELSQNVCISVLRAQNRMGFRSFALIIGVLVNLLITMLATPIYGYYAAAVGTAISITFSSLILMNIYYYKKVGLNIFRIFKNLLLPTLPGILLAALSLWIANQFLPSGSWIWFGIKILVYLFVLGVYLIAIRKKRPEGV